jgi:hypothetical protein
MKDRNPRIRYNRVMDRLMQCPDGDSESQKSLRAARRAKVQLLRMAAVQFGQLGHWILSASEEARSQ